MPEVTGPEPEPRTVGGGAQAQPLGILERALSSS